MTVSWIFLCVNSKEKKTIFFFSIIDLVGYLINSTTAVKTNTSVYIGDILDLNTTVFINNCTQLSCKSTGVKKEKIPCQGKFYLYFDQQTTLFSYFIYRWL